MTLRISTRASRLALAQANWVADRLAAAGHATEIVEVTTTGDVDRTSPVTTLTEVGAFVRSVQHAVLDGEADVAVHSCKDLPVAGPEGLVRFFPERASAEDVLVGADLASLPAGAIVGTGSPRRQAQLAALRPDLDIRDIRGNVDTRIASIGSAVDALVLAAAGLERLGRADEIAQRLTVHEMVPAPAQGALCIEALEAGPAADALAALDDPPTRRAVTAERELLALTGAGCRAALGALATRDGTMVTLTGFVSDGDGARRAVVTAADPHDAAQSLKEALDL